VLKFGGDPTVGSKVMALQTGILVWCDEPFASPSSDSTSTPRKTASGNSYKNLRAIQLSDQKFWPFRTGTLVSRDETFSTISDSTSTPRKTASENSCKNLMAIQRSDQKLWPFRTGTMVWRVETFPSTRIDSTSSPRKTASGNSC
jgi:hypothetical protein